MGGARQIECTINGIGERAGNAALEEVVMAIRTRPDFGLYTDIKTPKILATSQMLSNITGVSVQPNKAIVGANAFAHEAGIHQDGMLKNPETYEIMKPEDVGVVHSQLVLGKHSGQAAVFARLEKLGFPVSDDQKERVFDRFKQLADKKEIVDADLVSIVLGEENTTRTPWKLTGIWGEIAYSLGANDNGVSYNIVIQNNI